MLTDFNPLSPNIKIQILHTDLYTFPLRIGWENLIKDQGIFSLVIILLILIASSLNNIWILLGENWSWSLLVLKGLSCVISFSLFFNLKHWRGRIFEPIHNFTKWVPLRPIEMVLELLYATSICHDFQPSTRSQFSLTASTMCHMNVMGLIYTARSVVKTGCMLVTHDSHKQKL